MTTPAAGANEREPLIELTNASLIRGDHEVLHRITLALYRGQHTAILGPNGAGKSSLLRLFTADSYALVDRGAAPVRFFGRDRADVSDLRRRIGVVSPDLHQQIASDPWIARRPALEVVTSGLLASLAVFAHQVVTPEMHRSASVALERAGAAHLAETPYSQLSVGEARRALIARALVTAPELLLLDEPTTGLDVVARARFLDRVRDVARDGTTVVLVTHHVEEIFPEVERVILLDRGKVAADDETARVLTGPVVGEVFGASLVTEVVNGYYTTRMRVQ